MSGHKSLEDFSEWEIRQIVETQRELNAVAIAQADRALRAHGLSPNAIRAAFARRYFDEGDEVGPGHIEDSGWYVLTRASGATTRTAKRTSGIPARD